MQKIIVYTSETCPYCKQVKEELKKQNIDFIEELIDESNDWKEIRVLTGIPMTPTIYYNGEYIAPGRDFSNPQHLIEILNTENNLNISKTDIIYEKVKTLTFQMSNAFGRMDQLLRQIENKLNIEEDEHESTD
jgi:glutaredoxin